MEEKEKKSLRPVFLILGIAVFLAAVFLALCLGIVGFGLLVYGPQQPYVGEKDFLTALTDPTFGYVSYSWFESEFDGYYSMYTACSTHQSQSTIEVSITKY